MPVQSPLPQTVSLPLHLPLSKQGRNSPCAQHKAHDPGDLQSPVLPLVPRGARDTHVTKATDATWSPDSVTSATVTGATAKPIKAPLLEKEPEPS